MKTSFYRQAKIAGLAMLVLSSAALASVTFNSSTGVGFVGKGDVQTLYGWNNAQLQNNAGNVGFRFQDTETATWNCEKIVITGNGTEHDIIQVRSNITNTEGIVASIGRMKTQITGFNLNGWDGSLQVTVNGPALGSCPDDHSGFVMNSLVIVDAGGGLQVTAGGNVWNSI
jgi:hypothetical protein